MTSTRRPVRATYHVNAHRKSPGPVNGSVFRALGTRQPVSQAVLLFLLETTARIFGMRRRQVHRMGELMLHYLVLNIKPPRP